MATAAFPIQAGPRIALCVYAGDPEPPAPPEPARMPEEAVLLPETASRLLPEIVRIWDTRDVPKCGRCRSCNAVALPMMPGRSMCAVTAYRELGPEQRASREVLADYSNLG